MIAAVELTQRRLMLGKITLQAQSFRCNSTGVDVWCLPVEAIRSSGPLGGTELLNVEERARHLRFRFQADRDAYLAKRLLVRGALSEYANVAPGDWRFVDDAFGRPGIAEASGVTGLQFSLSRSGGLVVCGISGGKMMGVDVEDLARPESEDLPMYVLSLGERERLALLTEEQRAPAFLRLWTLKEAYVKARGTGLSLPVEEASFDYRRAQGIGVQFGVGLKDDATRWRFGQVSVLRRYVVATAARGR